ncbi:S-adenosyl-L-methionine-dependent methyltransferase [Suillus brevipes Sb2]|nr:S-adenosyl-L-methionine-dependent methyltransferase [Suillus brevipes Sb2]
MSSIYAHLWRSREESRYFARCCDRAGSTSTRDCCLLNISEEATFPTLSPGFWEHFRPTPQVSIDKEDNDFEDWVSDQAQNQSCRSLFEDKAFSAAAVAREHDKDVHNFDLHTISAKLELDLHQRLRLINFIRKHAPTSEDIGNLNGAETFFSSDEYLIPQIEDGPLLQLEMDDWSDDEDLSSTDQRPAPSADLPSALRQMQLLERKLAQAHRDMAEYRSLNINEPVSSSAGPLPRDDDTHYFSSYCENDIHAVRIQDKVRTSTYASFILTNPILFRDAVVLDVGCGTGILSLLAVKSGAKHVYAVDASDITERAEQIVKANGLENVITLIQGKVEEIFLPGGVEDVDIIIISEWMGYALLHESMLDSVLQARDRFLKPEGGVMAPRQCRIIFGLCEGSEILKERVGFWSDVYGTHDQ